MVVGIVEGVVVVVEGVVVVVGFVVVVEGVVGCCGFEWGLGWDCWGLNGI